MSTDNKSMQSYLLEPKAPLIIRSGRPFDEQAGADDARFPPPSTMAGALRAAYARSNKIPFSKEATKQIIGTSVIGPLPVKMKQEKSTLLVPKPEDAHYYPNANGGTEVFRVVPTPLQDDEGWDLEDALLPLTYQTAPPDNKPVKGIQWWSYDHFLAWRNNEALDYKTISENGWIPPSDDIRTHVGINENTYAAADGLLFQTSGLPMWQANTTKVHDLGIDSLPNESIGLLGAIEGNITDSAVNLGGERRLAKIYHDTELWPQVNDAQIQAILKTKQLTLTLLTPALFEHGWLPCTSTDEERYIYQPDFIPGLELELNAAAVGRWQPNSGWDLSINRPKPSRKMVPAGAVYWFTLRKGDEEHIKQLWLANISSASQDRKDGFGLVLPHSASFTTHSTSGDQ